MMITKTRGLLLAPTFWIVATATAGAGQPPAIRHEPLRCVPATGFPRVDAGVSATAGVQRTRVYFKAHQHPDWYYVEMRALQASRYLALLPQPLPETKQLDYYVHAVDSAVQMTQTNTYGPEVSRGPCRLGRAVPLWKWPVAIVIGATKAGQAAIPPGFSPAGITAFVTQAGVTVTGAALTSGGTSGVVTSTTSAAATGGTSAAGASTTTSGSAAGSAAGTGAAGAASTTGGATSAGTATAATTAAGSAATSGGSSALLLVGGGVAAAAAGVAALVATRGDEPVRTPVVVIAPEPYAIVRVTELAFSLEGAGSRADRYSWSFGDGATASGGNATHVYAIEGTFTVTATATDGLGAASATVVVRSLTGTWMGTSDNPGMVLEVTQEGTSVWGREISNGGDYATFTGTIHSPMSLALTFRGYASCPTLARAHTGEVRAALTFLAHYGMNCNWNGGWRFSRP